MAPKVKTPAPEKSREQIIADLLRSESTAVEYSYIPPVVPSRMLCVGDQVGVGNLEDCVVAGVSSDGRFVVIDHTRVDTNYGRPIRHEHRLGIWSWLSATRLSDVGATSFARKERLRPSYMNSDISAMISIVLHRGIVDNPDYQRDYVWTLEDKERLIDSVFQERSVGSFLYVNYPHEKYQGKLEVLDGKQRLNTLVEFYSSVFPFKGKYYHELSGHDKGSFLNASVQFAELDGKRMTRANLLQVFLDVNCAGVPQTTEHLAHVQGLLDKELALDR